VEMSNLVIAMLEVFGDVLGTERPRVGDE